MKSEIKYLKEGVVESVEEEITKKGKKASYDFDALVTALKSGKKYVLPSNIARVNTIYDIMERLKKENDKIFERVTYGIVKGTRQKKVVKSKNNKEYSYTIAQYFLYIPS